MPFFPILVSAQSVKDLCDHHVEELGGKAAIQRVKTLEITQVGTSNGMNMPTTTVIIPGKAYYQKVRTGMETYTTCAYGDKGWSSSTTQSSKTIDLPSKMVRSLIIDSKFYGPLCDYYINGSNSNQGGRIKMRSPPKVLTGSFHPSQLSSFLSWYFPWPFCLFLGWTEQS